MTIFFRKERNRWAYTFVADGRRYQGYCLDAHGQPVTSRSAARQAEGVERRRAQMEPKVAKPGEMTVGMATAALTPIWSTQPSWPARQIWLRELLAFFGIDTAISAIDQARVDDYISHCRTAKVRAWSGGPKRDPFDPAHGGFWHITDRTRSAATVNLYLGTLRQIFERAGKHRDPITGQPVFAWLPTVPEIRRPKRKPRPTPDQVSAEIMTIMPQHVVDAMMLTALFGPRGGETFSLLRTNIDWDNCGLRLHAEDVKDDEDAFLPASQFAMGYLRCLDMEAEARGVKHLITWQPKKGGPWVPIKKPRGAWRRARAFMQAKYGRTWRWHDLRAAFITSVAVNSGGIVAQNLARHSDFATTQGYIEVADEVRRLAAERISTHGQEIANKQIHYQNSLPDEFAPAQGRRNDRKPRLKSVG